MEKRVRKLLGQSSSGSSDGDRKEKNSVPETSLNPSEQKSDPKPDSVSQLTPSLVVNEPETSPPSELQTETNTGGKYKCPGIGDNTYLNSFHEEQSVRQVNKGCLITLPDSPRKFGEDIQKALLEDILTNLNKISPTDPDNTVPLVVKSHGSDTNFEIKGKTVCMDCDNVPQMDPILPVDIPCEHSSPGTSVSPTVDNSNLGCLEVEKESSLAENEGLREVSGTEFFSFLSPSLLPLEL